MATELKLQQRTALGHAAKKLRREGLVPAEIYGRGYKNRHVAVAERDLRKAYAVAGEHGIVTAMLGDERVPIIIADVQRDAISGRFLSADFHQIRMNEKIHAKVPVVLVGNAPAVKAGFVVLQVIHELEVEALPGDIPAKFEVSIEKLETPGDHVSISDIPVSNHVKIRAEAGSTIANVQEKRVEEMAPAAATPATPTANAVPADGAPTETTPAEKR